ncbi:MAG: GspH/FimT family pseudopilin [Pseudomonadota bacterium]
MAKMPMWQTCPPPETRADSGFSLLELLTVVTVLALVASLAMPRLAGSREALELRAAAQSLSSTFRLARSRAVATNREVWVTIDVRARTFSLMAGIPRALPAGAQVSLVTARSERLDRGRGRIRFYPDGTSTGGEVGLRVGSAARALVVDWFDGSVVERGEMGGARDG